MREKVESAMFHLTILFPHCAGDNTARTKILDWTPYRNRQQLDCLCNWIANAAAWPYSGKPVLHLRMRSACGRGSRSKHERIEIIRRRRIVGRSRTLRCNYLHRAAAQPRCFVLKANMGRSTRTGSQLTKGLPHRHFTLVLLLLGLCCRSRMSRAPHPAAPVVVHVTPEEYPIASLKSRLIRLLTDSLIDEGHGLDVARERQIQKLMKQIKEESAYDPFSWSTRERGHRYATRWLSLSNRRTEGA